MQYGEAKAECLPVRKPADSAGLILPRTLALQSPIGVFKSMEAFQLWVKPLHTAN